MNAQEHYSMMIKYYDNLSLNLNQFFNNETDNKFKSSSYLDIIKIVEDLLKSKKINNEWSFSFKICSSKEYTLKLLRLNTSILITKFKTSDLIDIIYYPNNQLHFRSTEPETKQDWVNLVNKALDKYYKLENQTQQLSKVDLKAMLGKALKDNNLIAQRVSIITYNSFVLTLTDGNFISWYKSPWDKEIVCSFLDIQFKYSLPSTSTDWQTIFSNSLAEYKKYTQYLKEKNIISCLENITKHNVSAVFFSNSNLVGTLKITWNNIIIEWILSKEIVEVYWGNKSLCYIYSKPTTLQDWKKLFKETFNRVIYNILFNETTLKENLSYKQYSQRTKNLFNKTDINDPWDD